MYFIVTKVTRPFSAHKGNTAYKLSPQVWSYLVHKDAALISMLVLCMLNQISYVSLSHTGADCVIVKSKRRLCGTGAALTNAPLLQDKSYFEVKIQTGGVYM